MKRQDLEAKLSQVDNSKELIDYIMAENGKDITKLQGELAQEKDARSKAEASLQEYNKGGSKWVDTKELDELRTFKQETQAKEIQNKKTQAVSQVLQDAKASDKVLKLLLRAVDYSSVELDADGNLKNKDAILSELKKEYPDCFVVEQVNGAQAGNPAGNKDNATVSLEKFKIMGYKERNKLNKEQPELYAALSKQEKEGV